MGVNTALGCRLSVDRGLPAGGDGRKSSGRRVTWKIAGGSGGPWRWRPGRAQRSEPAPAGGRHDRPEGGLPAARQRGGHPRGAHGAHRGRVRQTAGRSHDPVLFIQDQTPFPDHIRRCPERSLLVVHPMLAWRGTTTAACGPLKVRPVLSLPGSSAASAASAVLNCRRETRSWCSSSRHMRVSCDAPSCRCEPVYRVNGTHRPVNRVAAASCCCS